MCSGPDEFPWGYRERRRRSFGAVRDGLGGQAGMFGRGCFFRLLMACVLGGLQSGLNLLNLTAFGVFRLAAGVVLGLAPRFLGGGKDGDLFLFAAFRVTAG